jgi:hypothetical protein
VGEEEEMGRELQRVEEDGTIVFNTNAVVFIFSFILTVNWVRLIQASSPTLSAFSGRLQNQKTSFVSFLHRLPNPSETSFRLLSLSPFAVARLKAEKSTG